ncbi:hypothetical protein AB0J40_34735 [Amycolatopsis sp. NPDC049691]|uniref:hypothetical protein n=1 Tax=Amycolatopsis sp. NPDC049691 TaxID=3155155 RepID=UPI003432DFBC
MAGGGRRGGRERVEHRDGAVVARVSGMAGGRAQLRHRRVRVEAEPGGGQRQPDVEPRRLGGGRAGKVGDGGRRVLRRGRGFQREVDHPALVEPRQRTEVRGHFGGGARVVVEHPGRMQMHTGEFVGGRFGEQAGSDRPVEHASGAEIRAPNCVDRDPHRPRGQPAQCGHPRHVRFVEHRDGGGHGACLRGQAGQRVDRARRGDFPAVAPVLRPDLPERPRPGAGLVGAAAEDDEKPIPPAAAQQEVQETQRRFVAPLGFFDDNDGILFPQWPGQQKRS